MKHMKSEGTKSCERSERSQDGLLGLEQLLYEVSYHRKMLYDESHDAACDSADDTYEIIVPRILATLLRRTRLILFLLSCVIGIFLTNLLFR